MTRINLLPWREERRQELKRQFFMVLVGMLVLGAGAVYLVNMSIQAKIEYQDRRNDFIVQQTKTLDTQIKQIKELKKQRASLIDRMRIIQDLQLNRPNVVKVFDALARTLPDGVYYKRVKETGRTIHITGYAESNNRVSNLMRNLDASPLFTAPNLSKVTAADKDKNTSANEFDLTVQRKKPQDEKKDS